MTHNSKLRESDYFEEVIGNSDFLAKIIHEIRTPIHGISGISSYLYENWEAVDDDVKRSCINEICESGKFLEILINKLSSSFQTNSNSIIYDIQPTDLVEIIETTINSSTISLANKNSINILLNCKVENTKVHADPFWIGQVLTNLIINALKHSNCKNIEITINYNNSLHKELMISVNDDGSGILEKDLQVIFDSFKQGSVVNHHSTEGFGLGLALCKEIIKDHGGEIWAKNNEDSGASIVFTLPSEYI